jgi:hypothetical protein
MQSHFNQAYTLNIFGKAEPLPGRNGNFFMVNMYFIEVLGERFDDKNTVKASWHFFEKSLFVHRRNSRKEIRGRKLDIIIS